MGWAILWAIFSQTHLVTLVRASLTLRRFQEPILRPTPRVAYIVCFENNIIFLKNAPAYDNAGVVVVSKIVSWDRELPITPAM
jgi:hypothetical protein